MENGLNIVLGNFRITNALHITAEGFKPFPVNEKIAVEYRSGEYKGEPTYVVVAFISYDAKEGYPECDWLRLEAFKDLSPRDLRQFQTAVNVAVEVIKGNNLVDED